MTSLVVGQFELIERIGKGGMGEVWRGHHVKQGIPVAVKVMTVERARKEKSVAAFRNEVHAMARLNHPGIVRIFDTGVVPRLAEEASFGQLVDGSPTVTMELATHGTLEILRSSLTWSRVKAIVFGILDALSHAHARGVIHRDLKPGNILVTLEERRPKIKLADFGLAHAAGFGDISDGPRTSGTPRYMAPEQVEGKIRDQGPWTDLYALGCVLHYLLNGEPPFSGKVEDVLAAHVYEEVPELQPKFEVPEEFLDWVDTLLEKDRGRRFSRAADAAYALYQIEPDVASLEESFSDIWEDIPNAPISASALEIDGPTVIDIQSPHFSSLSIEAFHRTIHDIPKSRDESDTEPPIAMSSVTPIPLDWRRPTIDQPSPKLIGAGLALYGLRPIPFVGREEERDIMWQALREVRREAQMRFVEVRGPIGAGKSRLAEWFSRRAHEVGGATPLLVTHGESIGPSDGLVPALRRALGCEGMKPEKMFQRIRQLFFRSGGASPRDMNDCVALTEMFSEGTQPTIRFGSPTERYVLFRRVLRRLTHERPLMLIIDDAQWGIDAIDFVEYLSHHPNIAVLVVATVRDEASRIGVQGRVKVRKLARNDWASSIELPVLADTEHRKLVRQLLPLSEDLVEVITTRTAGNPLFAVQLIADWVQREILEVADDGFVLSDGSSVFLPDSMHEVWLTRIEQLQDEFPDIERVLTIAAVLGLELETDEWIGAAKILDETIPADLLIHLVQQRLAVPKPSGWSFTHAMFRESLLRRGWEVDRNKEINRAIADYLETVTIAETNHQLRLAQHRLGSDQHSKALPIFLDVASKLERTSAFTECLRILDRYDEVLSELETPFEDPKWAPALHLRGTCLLRQGDVAAARDTIEYAIEMAQNDGWETTRPELVLLEASLARKRGDSNAAKEKYIEARSLFDDFSGQGRCIYGIGEMLAYQGDIDSAIEHLELAVEIMSEHDPDRVGIGITGLANALIRKGDFDDAREKLDQAAELLEEAGNRSGRAAALNTIGELERSRKNWDEAANAYSQALEILEAVGSWTTTVPKLNLALIHLARSEYDQARGLLEAGVEGLEKAGEIAHLGFANIALCVAYAGTADWPSFTKALNDSRQLLEQSRWKDIEIAEHAEAAALLCHGAGQKGLAAEAYKIAEDQYLGVKMPKEAQRIRTIISRLFL